MRRARLCAGIAGLAMLAACHDAAPLPQGEPRIDPRRYDAFYLWPGVTPPAGVHARTLYLLDGEIRRTAPARFLRLRQGTPHLPGTVIWLVVRADRLDWSDSTFAELFGELDRWQAAGNTVAGLQIDFDAAARGIRDYRRFLADVRRRMPPRWQLSITGLMDWSAHGDPQDLRALRSIVDEAVVQTYQGRTTILGYDAYFRQMRDFPVPFRVALVQGGRWTPPPGLTREPNFRGYVVFLVRRPHRD